MSVPSHWSPGSMGGFDVLLNAVNAFEDLLHRRGQIAQVDRPCFHAFLHKLPTVEGFVELFLAVFLEHTRQKSPSWLKMTPSP